MKIRFFVENTETNFWYSQNAFFKMGSCILILAQYWRTFAEKIKRALR
jgi:hypothetical protein